MAGFDPFSIAEEQYTVPLVINEVKAQPIPQLGFDAALECGRLRIKAPAKEPLEHTRIQASKVGDAETLSPTDIQLLALAYELKTSGRSPVIVTDDYAIQNVANQMSIEFTSQLTFGIRRRWEWKKYCPACRKQYSSGNKAKKCEVCGTELKRKPQKKKQL